MEKKTIVVGLPNTGTFDWRTVASLLSFEIPKGYQLNFNIMSNCLVYDARERIAEYATKLSGATHLFFLDSDMIPPRHTLKSLLSHQKDIISGKIFKRSYPFQPCFYTKARMTKDLKPIMEGPLEPEKWPKEGAHGMEGVGMACCLIDLKVFKDLPKPWFYPLPNAGEDLTFCMKAIKLGFKIYVDFAVDCGHIADYVVKTETFQEALKAWMADPKNKGKLIYNNDGEELKI